MSALIHPRTCYLKFKFNCRIETYSVCANILISSPENSRNKIIPKTLGEPANIFISRTSCGSSNIRRFVCSGPKVDIPSFSCLTDYIFDSFDLYSSKTALIDYDSGLSVRFDELRNDVTHISSNLVHAGIQHSDVITYFGTNRVELIHLLCAANRIGAILSLANGQLTTDELLKQLTLSGTKMLVTTPECADVATRTAASHGIDPPYVVGSSQGCVAFSRLKDEVVKSLSKRSTSSSDVALLPFSSGTSGMPKGVQLSNENLIAELHSLRHSSFIPLGVKDVSICALPMVHIAGLVIGCLNALAQGATTVVLSKFSPAAFMTAIQYHKGTFTLVAPPIMTMLAKDPIVPKFDLSSLTAIYSGAAPLDKTLTEMVAQRLHKDCIRQGYGMTECSPATHTSPLEGWKFGSIGVPLPNTQCKVVSVDDFSELGPDAEGELWIRGPQVMLGYHGNHEATQAAFSSDGWLRTGDIGYFDTEGHFFICDRLKDVIKYKGYQVAPAYLESVLLSRSDIRDAAVVGMKRSDGEEVPLAWVVVEGEGCSPTAEEIRSFVDERVAPYKRLRGGVKIVEGIPKSPSGKILRRKIQEIETAEAVVHRTTGCAP